MKKITDYLNNKLSEQASEELTQQLVRAQFDQAKRLNWQKTLEDQYQVSRTKISKKNKRFLSYTQWRNIAAIFFVISIAFLFYLSQDPSLEEKAMTYLVEQKHQAKSNIPTRGDNTISALNLKAYKAYEEGNYDEARRTFEQLILAQPKQNVSHFYLGLSHLYLQDYDQAISTFKILRSFQQNNNSLEEEANWFLALAYICNGQNALARKELENIVETQSWNFEKAKDFLATMK